MSKYCANRLTIIGRSYVLKKFDEKGQWPRKLGARHIDLLVFSAGRHAWQFETDQPPLEPLKRISLRWPSLTFLLEYEWNRSKGLTKARNGQIVSHQVSY